MKNLSIKLIFLFLSFFLFHVGVRCNGGNNRCFGMRARSIPDQKGVGEFKWINYSQANQEATYIGAALRELGMLK